MSSIEKYKSIAKETRGIYKEKGSKFIAICRPVEKEEDFKSFLADMKKEFHDARHHCYAFRMEPDGSFFRYSDDGEPNNSAGMPVYGQLLSKEISDVAAIVVRYFGGTKLGVSGLITAYKESTRDALENAKLITKKVLLSIQFSFDYSDMNTVMKWVDDYQMEIRNQEFTDTCLLNAGILPSQLEQIEKVLEAYPSISIKRIN